jgi:hypothetical protein
MHLFLVFANHADQGVGHAHGQSDQLSNALKRICNAKTIYFIAEELSEEALWLQRSHQTTCRAIANEQRVVHLFCDPDCAEREKLGIPSEKQLKSELGIGSAMSSFDERRLATKMKEFWPIREAHWLKRIRALRLEQGLFVCGRDHRETFPALLRTERVTYESVEWG